MNQCKNELDKDCKDGLIEIGSGRDRFGRIFGAFGHQARGVICVSFVLHLERAAKEKRKSYLYLGGYVAPMWRL